LTRLRNVVATGITIVVLLAGFAVYQKIEGEDDGVRLVVTWEVVKPDHIVFDVAGITHVVDPVPGKVRSDTWRFYSPLVAGASYGVGVYLNYSNPTGRTHNYTCSIYVKGVLQDHGYNDTVGSIRCRFPKENQ
jgi:hypothetical protein